MNGRNMKVVVTLLIGLVLPVAGQSVRSVATTANEHFSELNDGLAQTADALLAEIAIGTSANLSIANSPLGSNEPGDEQRREFARRYWQGRDSDLARALQRIHDLRTWVHPALRNHGLPDELLSVALVESAGRSDALSPRGARGLWQLMPKTAQLYGLKVQPERDDRLDVTRSTSAAAQHLCELYSRFNDWRLALAAYNVGATAVQQAITKANSSDFDVLSGLKLLPPETRAYVPAVLAGMELLRGKSNAEATPEALARSNVVYAFSQASARAGGD